MKRLTQRIGAARCCRDAVYRYAGTQGTFAVQDRRSSGFSCIYELSPEHLYCEDNGRSSCDPVILFQLVLLQHLFDVRSLAAKHAGCTSQCDISLVSGVHHVGGFAALCNDQLRILTYSRRNRRGVPVEPEASRSRGLSAIGSYGCGWNARQSEREPRKS